ncbi:translation elongation factor Ts [Anaerolineales bacterium HSG25]|nr:translation elongation factor Ts [Anaerolineales bacterium HSG25]
MSISTADIKVLRQSTGAGVLDCKKALQETDGDIDAAIEFLRKKGLAAAAKKASREANDGLVSASITDDGKTGVLIEVNCETDFVARTDNFKAFVDELVQLVINNSDLTNVEALLATVSPIDSSKTVNDYLQEVIAKLGENMIIRRVARYDLNSDGLLDSYIHMGGRVGVLVEAGGSSDEQASQIVHDIALQIAAVSPQYVTTDEIPAEAIEAEKEIYRAQLANDKKPDNIKERIIEGKLKKWYSEVALVEQEFVKESKMTIDKLLKSHSNGLTVRRFTRFELGAN